MTTGRDHPSMIARRSSWTAEPKYQGIFNSEKGSVLFCSVLSAIAYVPQYHEKFAPRATLSDTPASSGTDQAV